jgi:hypothetical protein
LLNRELETINIGIMKINLLGLAKPLLLKRRRGRVIAYVTAQLNASDDGFVRAHTPDRLNGESDCRQRDTCAPENRDYRLHG